MKWQGALGFLLAFLGAAAARDPLIRTIPTDTLPSTYCNNTYGGRWWLADDTGRVCHRDIFDYTTGCCDKGAQFSCDTCEETDLCCSSYPHCVSCCMAPEHDSDRRLQEVFRGRNKPETGLWSTAFEYCQGVCRTTARSTQHENAFILDRRFCFSKQGRPRLPLPPLPPLPPNVTAHVGKAGQSCADACREAGGVCVVEALAAVNDCNVLRDTFPCEAGCSRANPNSQEFPGYVNSGAPKWQWPALCVALANAVLAQSRYNCTASQAHVQRICTCRPAPQPQPAPASAVGTGAAAAGTGAEGQPAGGAEGAAAGSAAAGAGNQPAAGAGLGGEGAQQQQQQQASQQAGSVRSQGAAAGGAAQQNPVAVGGAQGGQGEAVLQQGQAQGQPAEQRQARQGDQ